jgi:hypothetical protein
MDLCRDFAERCAPWGTHDAAHGASDNALIIRRGLGLTLAQPSRTLLDISCFMSPACPTFDLFGFFFVRFHVQSFQQRGF